MRRCGIVRKCKMENYSVLMSVYAKEKPEQLEIAMQSIFEQTVKTNDFVLVCDGILPSELNTIIKKMENLHPELNVIRYEKNQGLGKALDIGLKYCKNNLVARMDSDDIAIRTRCEKQLNLFEKMPELSICSGTIEEFIDSPENIVSLRSVPEKQKDIKKRMRTRSAFNHPAVMYKKSEVIRCGGYGKLKRKQDHDLFSRMMNMGCIAYNIQEPILLFRSDINNLKRRKSWINCKSYIIAQWHILIRGHCSLLDFIYVVAAQFFFYLAPTSLVDNVTKKYLRDKVARG